MDNISAVVGKSPFKFLQSFKESDADFFFGRKNETEILYELACNEDVIVVFGESGAGKSSLVQCGLVNRFPKTDWLDVWVRRGHNINNSLRNELLKKLRDSELISSDATIDSIVKELFSDYFRPVYLIFDQFEELFILGSEQEQFQFYDSLSSVIDNHLPCKIILIIREEYLSKLHHLENFIPDIFNKRIKISRMEGDRAKKVVELSAKRHEIQLIPDSIHISDKIVQACEDKEGKIYLPHLQIYLDYLWKTAATSSSFIKFDEDLINRADGIANVLKKFLNELIQNLGHDNNETVRAFLKQFVTSAGTGKSIQKKDIICTKSIDLDKWLLYFINNRILNYVEGDEYALAHDSLVSIIREETDIDFGRGRLQAPIIHGNPYKGLIAYDENDREIFCGRERVVNELYNKVLSHPFVAVVGVSGAGKSSVVKAGLLPKLREENFYVLPIVKPGERPDELISILNTNIRSSSAKYQKFLVVVDQYEELVTRCEDGIRRDRFIFFLKKLIEQPELVVKRKAHFKILITIRSDFEPQFEQLHLQNYWREGKFIIPPFSHDEIREIISKPAYLAGLEFSSRSLIDIISAEVAQSSGVLPLLSYTLSEMYNCYKESGREDNILSDQDYIRLGGVLGGLRTRADQIYEDADAPTRISIRNFMLRMISLGAGELAGRKVTANELDYVNSEENIRINNVIQAFLDKRLIVTGRDFSQEIYYEPAHDSLVRSWGKLWEWINKSGQEILMLQNRLRDAVNNYLLEGVLWDNNARLDLLQEIIKSDNNWLNKEETNFVSASINKRDALLLAREVEHEEKLLLINEKLIEEQKNAQLLHEKYIEQAKAVELAQKAERLANEKAVEQAKAAELAATTTLLLKEKVEARKKTVINLAIAVGISLAVAAGAIFYFFQYRTQARISSELALNAKREAKRAFDATREAERLFELARDSTASAVTARQSAEIAMQKAENNANLAKKNEAEAIRAKAQAVKRQKEAEAAKVLAYANQVKLGKEKDKVLTLYDSLSKSTARLEDQKKLNVTANRSGKLLGIAQTLQVNEPTLAYRVAELAFKEDTLDSKIRDYYNSLVNRKGYYQNDVKHGEVICVSPNGRLMLTSDDNGNVNLVDTDGELVATVFGESNDVYNGVFSPSNDTYSIFTRDELSLWNANGKLLNRIRVPEHIVSCAYSPSGEYIALVTGEGGIRLYSREGKLASKTSSPQIRVESLSFTRDGNRLLTASRGSVLSWTIPELTKSEVRSVSGHEKYITSYVAPQGGYIITSSPGELEILNESGVKINATSIGWKIRNDQSVTSVQFSPTGGTALITLASEVFKQQQQQQIQKQTSSRNRDTRSYEGSKLLLYFSNGKAAIQDLSLVSFDQIFFSQTDSRIILSSMNGTAGIYDTQDLIHGKFNRSTDKVLHTSSNLSFAAFNNINDYLMTATSDGKMIWWSYGTPQDLDKKNMLLKLTDDHLKPFGITIAGTFGK